MKSMTGFGYNEFQDEHNHIIINLKSYNNRFLDIIVYLPPYITQLEQRLRSYISDRVNRGRIELSMKIKELEEQVEVHLDKNIIHTYVDALKNLSIEAGISDRINLSHLLRVEGILKPIKNYDIEVYWKRILPILEKTFKSFEESRCTEGERTGECINDLLVTIRKNLDIIENKVPDIELKVREILQKKFSEVIGDEVDEGRILTETAVMLIKFDIKEEIARMTSHLQTFGETIKKGSPIGKKLDFICQEMNREVNTIGSKSIFLDVSNAVISIKDAVETIREQLRNVE
ncbi:MAG: YicC family protein [Spirochaetales bacterium]|nr:YicC family protein [Spirochaetales bacterium]